MNILRWLAGELGVRFKGITLMIDTVNGCGLRCPSCPVGNMGSRGGKVMRPEIFASLLNKLQSEIRVRKVVLTSFSDPLLNPHLPEIVGIVSSRGIPTLVSTNLNKASNLEAILRAGLTELRFTMSGWEYANFYQKGTNVSVVEENADLLAELIKKYPTKINVIFTKYPRNAHEEPDMREFCKKRGFGIIVVDAMFLTADKIISGDYTDQDLLILNELKERPEEILARIQNDNYCHFQSKQITLDALGQVYLCCNIYSKNLILGDFLNKSLSEFRKQIRRHPYCEKCKSKNMNKYYS